MNIILPIAGKAQRFIDNGYHMPKPLIMAKDRHIIDWAMSSIKTEGHNLVFIVRQDHIYNFGIDKILKNKFGNDIKIVVVDHITEGALCTCLLAQEYIDDGPLLIYTPDVYFEPQFDPESIDSALDGLILTFKANSPAHSYVQLNKDGFATKTAEKEVISNHAAVGVYYFKNGLDFVRNANRMISKQEKVNNEYYICPVYNHLINDGLKISIDQAQAMHVLGTPAELRFFIDYVCNHFNEKPIALCADHSGFETKELFKKLWDGPVIDFGTFFEGSCDYHDYVSQAAQAIKDGSCNIALGFCRTGQGINILANKYNHIRSALIFDEYISEFAVRHNCCNFFSVPTKYVSPEDVVLFIKQIMNAKFEGGRHMTRMKKTIDQGYNNDL